MTGRRSSFARRVAAIVGLGLAAAAGAVVSAAGPTYWTLANASDFIKGTSDGIFVDINGIITPGPPLTNRLTSSPSQIWSLAAADDGTLWAGTGGDGRVIRVRNGQPEETIFSGHENNVFALAVAGTRIYAATGPDGKVYAIESDGSSRVFFDPQEKYIWALAVDRQNRLWVGAGNPAVIYRVDANGTSQVVYRPPAAHVVALALDANGRMLAGTESPGRLYRFDANDHPFVLLDSGMTELGAIAADSTGVVFAAGVSKSDVGGSGGGEVASVAAAMPSSSATPAASSASSSQARRSALFRIAADGTWEEIWDASDVIYDLAPDGNGGVLAATGPDGRLYKIDRDLDVLMLTGVDAKEITRFAVGRPGALTAFATANPGRLIAVGSGVQTTATYVSPVRDSKSVATWGLIRWEASAPVALYTRSGNTEAPDDSWSDWAGPYTHADGDKVTSPAARFLQWRAVFTKPAAATATSAPTELSSVTVAYLPRNSRPDVTSVTTYPPGVVFQRPFTTDDSAIAGLEDAVADARRPPGDSGPTPAQPGRRMFQKGLQTITWKGDDDDNDRLVYTVEYRAEGSSTWHELKSGTSETIYVWDTSTVPDGRYIVRIVVSDGPSNASDRALSSTRESDPIDVDNTPPVITAEVARQGNGVRLNVRVHDARSTIAKLEWSLSGASWQVVYPVDGLADSPDERYEIPLASEADAVRVMLRATDAYQNVASGPAVIR